MAERHLSRERGEGDASGARSASGGRSAPGEHLSVLIVGTLGGGGIHRYVDEQYERLDERLCATVYDMFSDPKGEGAAWFLRSFLLSVWAALRFPFRRPPDVVHVHTSHRYSFYRASFYVLYAAHVWDRPVVLHVHGSSFDEFVRTDSRLLAASQSLVFGATDRVIVLSDYWEDVLADRVDASKLAVLPNAVDPTGYDPEFDVDPPHVVFVSNLVERKGVRELVAAVEALDEAVDDDYRVSIAGDGPLRDRVEDLEARVDAVDYLGYVSEERKRRLLSEGSVFVLPAYAEGLPIAMLEGMAGGNAVVSTGVGSIPEVIDDDNGVLVEPRDADALADALIDLVDDPDRADAMSRANRRLVEAHYSWDVASDELHRLYAEEAETAA